VSASEIEALLKVDARRRPCRQIVLDAYQQNAPLYVPLHIKYFQDVDAVTVDLIQRKITWGEAHRHWQIVASQSAAETAKMSMYYREQITQAHQTELAQRQQVAQALQQWSNQQQVMNALNRPRTTNCNYIGSQIQCTSF
jgi:hypothetical protein